MSIVNIRVTHTRAHDALQGIFQTKCETGKKCIDCPLFPDINHSMMLKCCTF